MCDYFSKQYPALNRDLLLTAAMFHDIGKTKELSADTDIFIAAAAAEKCCTKQC
jgi:23S rRNA maturation-related 3'-5' exoribonuclease YhaM